MTDISNQIEKHFVLNNVFKRGKRYFDIPKIKKIQQQQQLQRRLPQVLNQTIQSRVENSFKCSQSLLNQKVHNDINFFYFKQHQDDSQDKQTISTARTKRTKSIDMDKMLSRKDRERQKPKYRNQEQFNNFTISRSVPKKSLDFNYLSKKQFQQKIKLNPQKQMDPQKVGKIYQNNIFNQSIFNCLVRYQKKQQYNKRYQPSYQPVYDLQKVSRGLSLTQRSYFPCLQQFYHGRGKNQQSQMDYKLTKENENFWQKCKRDQKYDYSVEKRKNDQKYKRILKILGRKNLADERNQMCDEKYFRRNSITEQKI